MKVKWAAVNALCSTIVFGSVLGSLLFSVGNREASADPIPRPALNTKPIEYLWYTEQVVPSYAQNLDCLAKNVYFEARNQSSVGQLAVSHVVLNRVMDSRFPSSVCGVVHQSHYNDRGQPLRNKCHFSWFCDGRSDDIEDIKSYTDIYNLMIISYGLYFSGIDLADMSTHYHTVTSSPSWAPTKKFIMTIDQHHFYEWE
jgi:spore germination cell wall hydrolase CwlJ-like protein